MFVNQIGNTLKVLKNFHDHLYENSVPQDEPYIEMQQILVTWAPNVFHNLSEAVAQLKIRSQDIRSENVKPFLNVSFFPPGLGRFLVLLRSLQKRVNDQEGIQNN